MKDDICCSAFGEPAGLRCQAAPLLDAGHEFNEAGFGDLAASEDPDVNSVAQNRCTVGEGRELSDAVSNNHDADTFGTEPLHLGVKPCGPPR